MELPLEIRKRDLNPGSSNSEYSHCMGVTYFHGQQIVAYGSQHYVVIASNSLNVIQTLEGHKTGTKVTAVSWAPFSGRLSTSSDAGDLIIWEPKDGIWIKTYVLDIKQQVSCISWSMCDYQFCLSAEQFMIYNFMQVSRNNYSYNPKYTANIKTKFCSFSRDSRFILTLQETDQEVIIWHKRQESDTDYRKIPLYHPSPVQMMRWRTSDNTHERCTFMTLAQDRVVRIWTETGVNESLAFNVVAAIPSSYGSLSAAFLTTSSRMIKTNPSEAAKCGIKTVDNYAYGHGHLPVCDRDYREANVAGEKELHRNRSWIITSDDNHHIYLWELSGISVSVRRTPTLMLLNTIDCTYSVAPEECNQMFAVCRLESEFSHLKERDFIGRPVSISIMLQNKKSGMIESFDINLNSNAPKLVQVTGRTQGHSSQIKMIRINPSLPLMVTIDDRKQALVWKYDDTDVYDPNVLTKFGCSIDRQIIAADWLGPTHQLFSFSGNSFILFDVPLSPSPAIPIDYIEIPADFTATEMLDFRFCAALDCGYVFIALQKKQLDVLLFADNTVARVYTVLGNFTFGANAYVASVFPMVGSTVYFAATDDNKVISIILKGVERLQFADVICFQTIEPIYGVDYAHPGYLFVVAENNIYITWRECSDNFEFKELQKLPIDYKPLNVACIPSGMIAVVGKSELHLYHRSRVGHQFPKTYSQWVHAAKAELDDVSAMEWSLDGILIVASYTKLHAFTKFMDTFYLECYHIKYPSIHHSLASLSRGTTDYHPDLLMPLAIAGKFKLLGMMIEELNETYDNPKHRNRFTKRLLEMPVENIEEDSMTPRLKRIVQDLIEKFKRDPLPEYTRHETDFILSLLQNFCEIQSEKVKNLEPKAQPLMRAFILSPTSHIPFDLILSAMKVQSSPALLEAINPQSWEDVQNSGAVYWTKDVNELFPYLVPIAVNGFVEKRQISIILLTLLGRYKVLQKLFAKMGDDTRASFFIRDFSHPKNRKFAEKNAYSALSKHDFLIAASMFFLADEIDSVINVLFTRVGDPSLALLVCRCLDITKNTNSYATGFIRDWLIPKANEVNDLAAVEALKTFLDPEYVANVRPRLCQAVPGYLNDQMANLGDLRYNMLFLHKLPLSYITDYMRTLMNECFPFLAVTLVPFYNNLKLPKFNKFDVPVIPKRIRKTRSFSIDPLHGPEVAEEGSSDEESAPQKSKPNNRSNSLAAIARVHPRRRKIGSKFVPGLSILDHIDPLLLKQQYEEFVKQEEIKKLEEDKKEMSSSSSSSSLDDPFGFTGGSFGIDEDYSDYSESSDEFKSKSDSESSSEEQQKEIEEVQPQQESQTVASDTKESEWFSVVVVYNATRYRLEYFLETQYILDNEGGRFISENMEKVHPEVIAASAITADIAPMILEYLFRSAKRRCFIFRRLLLMPTDSIRNDYIFEVCRNLAMIPDQVISMQISSQQVTQIALTAQIIIMCINEEMICFNDEEEFNFIIASVTTALFMYAFFYQDAKLIHHILALNLKNLKKFPAEIYKSLDFVVLEPGEKSRNCPLVKKDSGFFSFLYKDNGERFIVENTQVDQKSLDHFAVALINFLLIDSFVRNIYDIYTPGEDFDSLYQVLKKLHDLFLQLFQYATLNFTVFLEFKSLSSIRINGQPELNKLLDFLLAQNQREQVIQSFCLNLLKKFSDTNLERYTTVAPRSELKEAKKVKKFKNGLRGIIINSTGDTILAATDTGLQVFQPSLDQEEVKEEPEEVESEYYSMIPDVAADNAEIYYEANEQCEESECSSLRYSPFSSGNPLQIPANDFVPYYNVSTRKGKMKAKYVTTMVAHTSQNIAFVGQNDGLIYATSFENGQKLYDFEIVQTHACRALGISQDGTLFASAHASTVSMYSFFVNSTRATPFAHFDTWGDHITCIEFVRGTGLFACGQDPSPRCKASITFWDSLLPNSSAMVASIRLPKGVIPTCLSYSPRFNQLVAGATDGSIYAVDARTFSITATFKAHEKSIRNLSIDKDESYLVTAGVDKSLRVWDMRKGQRISKYDISSRFTMRSYENVGIQISDNKIFAAYPNGSIFGFRFCQ